MACNEKLSTDSMAYCLVTKSCPTLLWPHGLQPARLLCPWDFSKQEYWSGLPCPPPGNLPNPGMLSSQVSCIWQADSLPLEPHGKPEEKIFKSKTSGKRQITDTTWMNLRIIWLREAEHERLDSEWFHLHKVQEGTKQT